MSHKIFISKLLNYKKLDFSKIIILITTVITVTIATFYLKITQPKWRASAVIKIARVQNNEPGAYYPETAEQVLEHLNNAQFLSAAIEKTLINSTEKENLLNSTYFSKASENTIEFQTKVTDKKSAKIFIETVIKELVELQNQKYITKVNNRKYEISLLVNFNNAINLILKQKSNSVYGLPYMAALSIIQNDNSNKILKLQESLSPEVTFPTQLSSEINLSNKPINPSKKIILTIAILMGLMNGYFIAFAWNSFSSKYT